MDRFGFLETLAALAGSAAANGAPGSGSAPDFTLTDQRGHAFRLSRERGKPVILFFGYAHCPDECPTILANLHRARVALGDAGNDLVVAMITVDPERDTPAALGRYVEDFDPAFLGLRGDPATLAAVYRAYDVRVSKHAPHALEYDVEHTSFVYYIGRAGRIRSYGTWADTAPVLAETLRQIAAAES
jgi:protein SCO1/2